MRCRRGWWQVLGFAAAALLLVVQALGAGALPGSRICLSPDCGTVLPTTANCCSGCGADASPEVVIAPADGCTCVLMPAEAMHLPMTLAMAATPLPVLPTTQPVHLPCPSPPPLRASADTADKRPHPHLIFLRSVVLTC